MSRVKLVGLAVTATLVFSAVAVASAWAQPEFKDGSSPVAGTTITVALGSTNKLNGTGASISCTGGSGTGEITSSTEATATITYTGCTGEIDKKACPATLSTKTVGGILGEVASSEAASGVGIRFGNGASSKFAEFECGGTKFTVVGEVAGEVTPTATLQTTGKVIFTASGSAQHIKTITPDGGSSETIKHLNIAGTNVGIESENNNTFSANVEVS